MLTLVYWCHVCIVLYDFTCLTATAAVFSPVYVIYKDREGVNGILSITEKGFYDIKVRKQFLDCFD